MFHSVDEQGFHGGPHLDELNQLDLFLQCRKDGTRSYPFPQPNGCPAQPRDGLLHNGVEVGQCAKGVREPEFIPSENNILVAIPPLFTEGIRISGKDHVSLMQQGNMVAQSLHAGHVMGGKQDGGTP